MTIQELKDLVRLKIAGQGTMVDAGGALPPVLNGILDTLAATQNVESVVVTVDGGEGTPSADATFADGVLTLAFHNLKGEKGDQGNTGSSVDYPFELVNNVTTDDATKALSAAQGVVLDNKISQLGQKLYEGKRVISITGTTGMPLVGNIAVSPSTTYRLNLPQFYIDESWAATTLMLRVQIFDSSNTQLQAVSLYKSDITRYGYKNYVEFITDATAVKIAISYRGANGVTYSLELIQGDSLDYISNKESADKQELSEAIKQDTGIIVEKFAIYGSHLNASTQIDLFSAEDVSVGDEIYYSLSLKSASLNYAFIALLDADGNYISLYGKTTAAQQDTHYEGHFTVPANLAKVVYRGNDEGTIDYIGRSYYNSSLLQQIIDNKDTQGAQIEQLQVAVASMSGYVQNARYANGVQFNDSPVTIFENHAATGVSGDEYEEGEILKGFSIVKVREGLFFMYYESLTSATYVDSASSLRLAYSTDGLNWTRGVPFYDVVKTEDINTEPSGTYIATPLQVGSGRYSAFPLRQVALPNTLNASVTYYTQQGSKYVSWTITRVADNSGIYAYPGTNKVIEGGAHGACVVTVQDDNCPLRMVGMYDNESAGTTYIPRIWRSADGVNFEVIREIAGYGHDNLVSIVVRGSLLKVFLRGYIRYNNVSYRAIVELDTDINGNPIAKPHIIIPEHKGLYQASASALDDRREILFPTEIYDSDQKETMLCYIFNDMGYTQVSPLDISRIYKNDSSYGADEEKSIYAGSIVNIGTDMYLSYGVWANAHSDPVSLTQKIRYKLAKLTFTYENNGDGNQYYEN